jgi:MSHA biogenesis protein MshQ
VYTLTFSSNNGSASPGLAFTRSATASNLFNADIALAVYVIDGDGVAYGSTPASFGALTTAGNGMAFSSGKEMRYGRLRVANTYGSELLPLPVNITAQYWNGTQYISNTADNCTSLAAANFAQAAPPTPGSTLTTTIQGSGTLSSGAGRITLTKPTGPVGPSGVIPKGSVDVSSTIPYLSPGLTGRETFGVYKSGPVIYMREIY